MISRVPSGASVQALTSNSSLKRVGLDHQAVVARGDERVVEPGEQPAVVVVDPVGLAVHQPLGPDDLGPEGLADGLMPQAHAQERHLARRSA